MSYSDALITCSFIRYAIAAFFSIARTASEASTRLTSNWALFFFLAYPLLTSFLGLFPADILSYLHHLIVPFEDERVYLVVFEVIELVKLKF